jgi:hypothetical protein
MDINSIRAKLTALQTQNSRPSGEARKNVFWKPAVGKQTIRIVPSAYNKSNPFSELFFHYGIDKNPVISPTNWGEKDPIVEFAKELRGLKDKESWSLARKLDPKMRVFVPIIVRGEEAEGVKLWGFGKEIYMELLSMVLKGDPVYTNIDIKSNKNTEKVILNNGFYKLSKLIDGIIKRIYVFSTNQVSSPDNRIYCNKEYIQTIIETKEISKHTRNTLKEYLELLK